MRINKSLITYIPTSGAGSGTVTSVALSATMPTGLTASISGSPITSSGTLGLTLSFSAGYSIPTNTKQGQWDSAYAFTSAFPTGSAGQLLRYNTLGTALEFFTPSYLTSADILATTPLIWNSGTKTMSIPAATASVDGYLTSTDWLTFSSKQPAITLTTTGNSGSATFVGATLNVPTYTLAGLGGLSNPFTGVLGQMIYSNAAGAPLNVAPNTTTTKKFLSMTGDGVSGDAPFWDTISPSSIGAVPTTRTLTINGTSYDLSADRSWSTITSLTGEATASGTGAVAVTLTNSAVIGKVLTGLNVTGGSVVATDTILQGFGKLQNQVNGLIGGVMYQGTWDASTNTPALASSVGTKGYYYVVSVAGNTNLNGILDWNLGDWAIFNGSVWEKVDNTDSVISVNGFTGAVSLTTANISEVTNLYYTDTRARLAISETVTGLDYNSSTGVLSTTSGYAIPTTAKQTEWDSAYTNRITSLTTTGNSGASTLIANTLNVPEYTLAGLGGMSNPMTSLGDMIYGNAAGAALRRSGNTTTTKMFLSQTGDGTSSAAPQWATAVTSVALTMPSAFSVGGSPITTSGTLAVTATGDTTQYIAGDGSLVAFPITGQAGTLVREVRNNTGATLTKGTVVYINGALGNKPTVAKALATSDATSAQTFGLIQADIPNNSNGYLVAFGDLDGLDTSSFTEGVQLYLSSTTAGGYTITKQYAPNHLVYIGVVTRSHPTQGRIEVRIQNGYEMDELHDVVAQTPSNNDGLFYNTSNSLWESKSIATALGFTPVTSARTLTINDVAFDLSANRSWDVGDYGTW